MLGRLVGALRRAAGRAGRRRSRTASRPPRALAGVDPADLPFPRRRGEALRSLARLVAVDGVRFDAGADASAALAALLDIPGVGPWTASYVAMRALGDPDAFPAGDVGIAPRAAAARAPAEGPRATALAEPWRPWRSYAVMHLWALVSAAPDGGLVADQPDQVPERDVRVHEVQAPARGRATGGTPARRVAG